MNEPKTQTAIDHEKLEAIKRLRTMLMHIESGQVEVTELFDVERPVDGSMGFTVLYRVVHSKWGRL